jgi:alpha-tubulin suppressor-like RCC1 family protein
VTANGATTTIDLSSGNVIYMTQSSNTTVSFANTEGNTDVVYLIRDKDATATARTITWPSGIVWNGGTEPTLTDVNASDEYHVFKLTTRDNGATWYGLEVFKNKTGGTLFAWGRNQVGILGQNEQNPGGYSSPIQVGSDTGWKYVWSASYAQNVWAKKTDGTMWAWGYGQRGSVNYNISDRQQSSPVQYPGTTWSDNFGGTAIHRFQTKTDGTLWVAGSGEYGDLAQNNRTYYSSPVQIPGTNWSTDYGKIIALEQDKGGGCIKTNGELWMWGRNSQGTLAQNHTNMRSSPVQVPGTNWEFLVQNSNWRVAGATKTDGTLWMWGSGSNGSMGQNSPQNSYSSPIQIPGTTWTGNFTMNNAWSIAVKSDGTMWGWGHNGGGLLGQNSRTYYSSPVQVPGTTWSTVTSVGNAIAFATKTDGTLWGWGSQPATQFSDFLNTSTTGISAPGQTAYSSPVQILGAWGHSKGQLAAANSGAVFAIKP